LAEQVLPRLNGFDDYVIGTHGEKTQGHSISDRGNLVPTAFGFNIVLFLGSFAPIRSRRCKQVGFQLILPKAVFQNTRLKPFLDQAVHACVIDPMLQKTDQPLLAG
jgi:hypothetical protein